MNRDVLIQLQNAFNSDDAFRKEILSANSTGDMVAAAGRRGMALTLDDFKQIANGTASIPEGSLSDAELQGVGGGKISLSEMFEMLSNVMKKYQDTSNGIAQNLRG